MTPKHFGQRVKAAQRRTGVRTKDLPMHPAKLTRVRTGTHKGTAELLAVLEALGAVIVWPAELADVLRDLDDLGSELTPEARAETAIRWLQRRTGADQ